MPPIAATTNTQVRAATAAVANGSKKSGGKKKGGKKTLVHYPYTPLGTTTAITPDQQFQIDDALRSATEAAARAENNYAAGTSEAALRDAVSRSRIAQTGYDNLREATYLAAGRGQGASPAVMGRMAGNIIGQRDAALAEQAQRLADYRAGLERSRGDAAQQLIDAEARAARLRAMYSAPSVSFVGGQWA